MEVTNRQKKFISELITTKDIASWTPEIIVLITAPTGAGKSHFIKYVLDEFLARSCKDCLYLLPRSPVIDQFRQEVKSPRIIYDSYQKIEYHKSMQTKNPPDYLSRKIPYIICDEGHYFFEDARFNPNNDISLDWILKQKDSVRIFMTATGDTLRQYLIAKGFMVQELRLPDDFEYISNLYFYKDGAQLELIAENIISSGNKGLFVISSAQKAHALWEKYKDFGMFMCSSRNARNYQQYMDNGLVADLLKNESFNSNILVTTAVLECGVNIKDRKLTTICLDLVEYSSIIQALGRKRFMSEAEKIDVYIKSVSNERLGGLIAKYERKLEQARTLESNHRKYEIKYGRMAPTNSMVYDESNNQQAFNKRIRHNEIFQAEAYIDIYKKMIRLGKGGSCKYMAQSLGKFDEYRGYYDYQMFGDEKPPRPSLYEYLESIVDVPMYTPRERAELIEQLDVWQKGRLCRGYETLSGCLRDSKMPFRLETFRKERVIDGKRRNYKGVWVIVKHNDKA